MDKGSNPRFKDAVTCLKSIGVKLTKTFDGDTVIPYGDAKHFTIEPAPVNNILDLHGVLKFLAPKNTRCVIRGAFKGDAAAQEIAPPARPGQYQRILDLFDEVPHHWVMLDIDRYTPMLSDPTLEPAEAVQEFIEDKLPPEFHQASYCWQLSSSAGRTPGMLKCHLWFWFSTAFTGPQLKAWVRANNLPIDVAPLRTVQVHYTADPIFLNGAVDPIAKGKRSGLRRGSTDEVALTIPEEVLNATYEGAGTSLDLVLTDPTKKPGVIGAFCTAYPISRVINELLPEEFVYAEGSDRRVTWLDSGSGSPEGCFVTDDDLHFGSTHNTDPADGRLLNAWDMVRLYMFGDKDTAVDGEDRWAYEINELPSHLAMKAWAAALPDVRGEAAEAATTARDGFLAAIRGAADEQTLRAQVLPEIAKCQDLGKVDRDILTAALQVRLSALTQVRISVAIARQMLREAGREGDDTESPFWVKPFVFVSNGDVFFNVDTKEKLSQKGFDANYNRFMAPFMNERGSVPAAHQYACDVWHIDCVSNVVYNPTLGRTFEQGGLMYANTYSEANLPNVPPVLTDAEEGAWNLVLEHVALLLPDAREGGLFLDWLAHNVQHPGRKIRWSPYLFGTSRAGKSIFHLLMEATMGPDNVGTVPAQEVIKSSYTAWANERALMVIEEVKVPDTSARETDNKLKPLITNDTVRVEAKHITSYLTVNVTNYLLFSNYGDGLPIDSEDQRYFMLRVALTPEEVKKLTAAGYYTRLVAAIKSYAGALRKKLLERVLGAEFQADGHAPWTSAKGEVIEMCKNDTTNAIEDLIKEGTQGVTEHVVSTSHLSAAVVARTGEKVFTRTVQRRLTEAGYRFFGRVKWSGEQRRVWVSEAFGKSLPGDEVEARKRIREVLDASGFNDDFLQ